MIITLTSLCNISKRMACLHRFEFFLHKSIFFCIYNAMLRTKWTKKRHVVVTSVAAASLGWSSFCSLHLWTLRNSGFFIFTRWIALWSSLWACYTYFTLYCAPTVLLLFFTFCQWFLMRHVYALFYLLLDNFIVFFVGWNNIEFCDL